MHGEPAGPVEVLEVGEGITIESPYGDVSVTVIEAEGDEVKLQVEGPEEVLCALGDGTEEGTGDWPLGRVA